MDSQVPSAVEIARTGLCRMIASGELSVGQLLPTEAELCEQFGVSRSSLREAQKMLMVAGALTPARGSRPAVSAMSAKEIISGLAMVVPLLPLDRFLELFNLREVLEGYAAAQAAARLSVEKRQELVDLAEKLADCPPSAEAQLLDARFHSLILEGSGDEMIAALLETIKKRGRDYKVYENKLHAELKAVSDQAHLAIATAIRDRDAEGAKFLAMQHVRVTRTWLEGIRPGPELFEQQAGERE